MPPDDSDFARKSHRLSDAYAQKSAILHKNPAISGCFSSHGLFPQIIDCKPMHSMPVRISPSPVATASLDQPNTPSVNRGSPPQYFSDISAMKSRRCGPLIFDAAKRMSTICSWIKLAGENGNAAHQSVSLMANPPVRSCSRGDTGSWFIGRFPMGVKHSRAAIGQQ